MDRWTLDRQTNRHTGQADLEKPEDCTTVISDHFKQSVKVASICGLTVWSTQCKCEKVQHGCYDQCTRTTDLQTDRHAKKLGMLAYGREFS